jgi:hypothetical protein
VKNGSKRCCWSASATSETGNHLALLAGRRPERPNHLAMERPVVFILFMIDAKGVVRERGTRGKDLDQTVERLVEEAMPKK